MDTTLPSDPLGSDRGNGENELPLHEALFKFDPGKTPIEAGNFKILKRIAKTRISDVFWAIYQPSNIDVVLKMPIYDPGARHMNCNGFEGNSSAKPPFWPTSETMPCL